MNEIFYFFFFFFKLSSTSGVCFRLMAYLDSNGSHFKCSIDKIDRGGYGAEHIFIGYEEKPLLSVHQQFSALATMGHPWRIMDAHFTGAGSVGFGERDRACPATGECNAPR